MVVTTAPAQKNKSKAVFDTYKWDFGQVNANLGAVCHTFTLENKSKAPVQIAKDIPSCECIKAIYDKETILPGQKAEVMVVLTPANQHGKTFRSVQFIDQNNSIIGTLEVKAMVENTEPAPVAIAENSIAHATLTSMPPYPFLDPTLSYDERVENLISLLTPEEKVGLMMNKSVSVDRLGIPSYNWWSEACHGVRQGGYTVFPQPIGMAAAFNAQQVYDVFSRVSDEARANWNRSDHKVMNIGMGVTYYPGNPELTFWCPNVNIFRDPRWGRGQETCGEDPYLNAVLGVQTVLGMQGNDDHYFKTHACAKHYAVHSGPEPLRHSYNASVSMRDLWETYLPAFKALVKKGKLHQRPSAGGYPP